MMSRCLFFSGTPWAVESVQNIFSQERENRAVLRRERLARALKGYDEESDGTGSEIESEDENDSEVDAHNEDFSFMFLIPKESKFLFCAKETPYFLNVSHVSKLDPLFIQHSEEVFRNIYMAELQPAIDNGTARSFYIPCQVSEQQDYFAALENRIERFLCTCVKDDSDGAMRKRTGKTIRSVIYYMLMLKDCHFRQSERAKTTMPFRNWIEKLKQRDWNKFTTFSDWNENFSNTSFDNNRAKIDRKEPTDEDDDPRPPFHLNGEPRLVL